MVEEPSEAECLQLLQGLAPRYEAHHRVHYAAPALAAAVSAAKRCAGMARLLQGASQQGLICWQAACCFKS